jgi:tRNA pseudouridine55 synthase
MKDIFILYKTEGETPLQAMERFREGHAEYRDIKMTYAGRLDPMAGGFMIVLAGEKVHEKEVYLNLDKVYEVEVLFGVATDTHDILGLVTETTHVTQTLTQKDIEEKLIHYIGKQEQSYPLYSSKTVEGKQLWQYAREELKDVVVPTKEIEIYEIAIKKLATISLDEMYGNGKERIKKVSGDFRQEEILKAWRNFYAEKKESIAEFQIVTLEISCSSGTYMRSLADRLGKDLGISAIAWRIARTRVGDFDTVTDFKNL